MEKKEYQKFVTVINELINKKIALRRMIFNSFGSIPEDILEKIVDKVDFTKPYKIRFIDDPEDFKYYIKEKEIIEYQSIIEESNIGEATMRTEEINIIKGYEIFFGKYIRHLKDIVFNEEGKFNPLENYILSKKIMHTELGIIEKKIKFNTVKYEDEIEYCIYVPDIVKVCRYKG